VVSLVVLVVIILTAVFAPVVAPYDPTDTHRGRTLETPSWDFLLGTDHLGRDLFSRIVFGARISITIGFLAVFLGTSGGVVLGIASGMQGGKFDILVQRLVDAWMAFPGLVIALALVSMLGPSLMNVAIAIAIGTVPSTSRVVRGAVLSEKERDYVSAVVSIGAARLRLALRHILPNVLPPILILATARLGSAILAESSLSFLGLGVPPPTPTWGGMLSREGREFMITNPMLGLWPGLSIMLTVLAFNLFGDGLRDILDPKLRGGH
jgi:peptide/nickel transport system permease protein